MTATTTETVETTEATEAQVVEVKHTAMNSADLLAASDLADLAGVTFATVANWASKEGANMPAPVALVARGRTRLWDRSQIEPWLNERKAEENKKSADRIAKLKAELARLEGTDAPETDA